MLAVTAITDLLEEIRIVSDAHGDAGVAILNKKGYRIYFQYRFLMWAVVMLKRSSLT